MPANPERGEVEIMLGGSPHIMRPTYEAQIEMEVGTGQKMVPLVRSVTMGNFGIRDLAIIITAGLHGGGETDATVKAVGKMIAEAGLGNEAIIRAVTDMLGAVMHGGGDATGAMNGSGEAKAAARN